MEACLLLEEVLESCASCGEADGKVGGAVFRREGEFGVWVGDEAVGMVGC